MDHNSGTYQGAFIRQDVVGEAVLLVMKDMALSISAVAKKVGVDAPLQLKDDGTLDQDKYFTQAHANVMETIKKQEEAKKRSSEPDKPLIVKPDEEELVEFGGDYEDSRTTDTQERQAAP